MKEALFLQLIYFFHFLEQAEIDPQLLRDVAKRGDIFGEARSAIADSGIQKAGTDAAVAPNSMANLLHVRSDRFTNGGDSIDE